MGHLVEKQQGGMLQLWNHDQRKEYDMTIHLQPGEDFLYIDAYNEENAKEQAEAYWGSTHATPQKIDEWVERARNRKRQLEGVG